MAAKTSRIRVLSVLTAIIPIQLPFQMYASSAGVELLRTCLHGVGDPGLVG